MRLSKLKLVVISLLVMFMGMPVLIPVAAQSQQLDSTNTVNEYLADEKIVVNEDVAGDILAAGDSVVINGNVGDNLFIAANAIEINGDITGDVLLAGGYIVLNGNVTGDARIVSAEFYQNSSIDGDLMLATGKYSQGVDSSVGGVERITSGNSATDVENNPTDISAAPDYNQVNFGFSDSNLDEFAAAFAGISIVATIIFKLIAIVGTILAGYFALRLMPVFSENTLKTMKADLVKSNIVGFIVVVMAPFLALLLIFSIIGVQLFALLAILGGLAFFLSSIYAEYSVGRYLLKRLNQKDPGRLMALTTGVLLVELVLLVLGLIPIIGGVFAFLISFFMLIWGVGAMVLFKYRSMQLAKPVTKKSTSKSKR